ncbi:unnamed protein product [Cylicostephanus goldi]|uniref:G-protein coupled receptors family 1 profile domain-containing protein n=1 Tax=Cylicostephanus goldi TaxID=71465 RepID=A0A3P7MQX2_CYLGO|nr:unnamed protein product [Cylicostephanus goldi]
MNVVVAIDRFLATVCPLWYFQTTVRYAIVVISVAYGISFSTMILNLVLVLSNENAKYAAVNVFCNFTETAFPGFRDIIAYYRWLCIVIAALLYIMVVLLIRKVRLCAYITFVEQSV